MKLIVEIEVDDKNQYDVALILNHAAENLRRYGLFQPGEIFTFSNLAGKPVGSWRMSR